MRPQVRVGGYAALPDEGSCLERGTCLAVEYVLLIFVASCGAACSLCAAAQRKYQARLAAQLGLSLYDADDEVMGLGGGFNCLLKYPFSASSVLLLVPLPSSSFSLARTSKGT